MLKSILHYNNDDSSADINLVNYILGQNNKIYLNSTDPATLITDHSSATIKIYVEPFYSMTKGGMIIQNTSQYNIDLTDGKKYEIILYAQHMSPYSRVELFAFNSYETDMIMGEAGLDPGAVGAGLTYMVIAPWGAYVSGDCIQRNSTDTGWNLIKAGVAGNPASGLRLLNNTGNTITLGGINILNGNIAEYIITWADVGTGFPAGCEDTTYHTLIAIIDLSAGGHALVTSSEIIYNSADHADTLNRNYFRGYKDVFADLPSNVNWNRIGDIYVVIANRQLYNWNGSIWETLTDTALATIINTHRTNSFPDEVHMTNDEDRGMANASNAITITNEVIERTTLNLEITSLENTILNNISSFQNTQRFQIAPTNPLTHHFLLHANMITSGKKLWMYLYGYILDAYFMKILAEHNHNFTTNITSPIHNHYIDFDTHGAGGHNHTTDIGHDHDVRWGTDKNALYLDANNGTLQTKYIHDADHTPIGTLLQMETLAYSGSPTSSSEINHNHWVDGNTETATANHAHTGTSDNTGNQTAYTVAYDYFDALQIAIDGTDITSDILTQLGWGKLGNGTATHAMITTGTGMIDLTAIMNTYGKWTAGMHYLTFSIITDTAGTLESLLYI